jgi:glutamate synthase domain-containing protein 3
MVRQALDAGAKRVRLDGVEGQRLLLQGLAGPWDATIEIDGPAGPELAFGLDAPHVTVVARDGVADGAGSGLRAGRLVLRGPAGDGAGFGLRGGAVVALDGIGARAGLGQSGGVLVLCGSIGALAGERQSGGTLVIAGAAAPPLGHGRRGGELIAPSDRLTQPQRAAIAAALLGFEAAAPAWLCDGGAAG